MSPRIATCARSAHTPVLVLLSTLLILGFLPAAAGAQREKDGRKSRTEEGGGKKREPGRGGRVERATKREDPAGSERSSRRGSEEEEGRKRGKAPFVEREPARRDPPRTKRSDLQEITPARGRRLYLSPTHHRTPTPPGNFTPPPELHVPPGIYWERTVVADDPWWWEYYWDEEWYDEDDPHLVSLEGARFVPYGMEEEFIGWISEMRSGGGGEREIVVLVQTFRPMDERELKREFYREIDREAICRPAGPCTHIVNASVDGIYHLMRDPDIRWIGEYLPEYKYRPDSIVREVDRYDLRALARDEGWGFEEDLEGAGVPVLGREMDRGIFLVEARWWQVPELAELWWVERIRVWDGAVENDDVTATGFGGDAGSDGRYPLPDGEPR